MAVETTASRTLVAAYDGVEAQENFRDRDDEARYRQMVLEKSRQQAEFILDTAGRPRSMLEACCGNGRLLMTMRHDVEQLHGYDLAASRIDFAHRWIESEDVGNIAVWIDDCCEPSPRVSGLQVDMAVCITGAFGYFGALGEAQELAAVAGMISALSPGGTLLLELYTHPDVMALIRTNPVNTLRLWQELPDHDPFRFALSAYRLDQDRGVLQHEKTFIARDDGAIDSGRREALKIHDMASLSRLIGDRFEEIAAYGDWDGRAFDEKARRLIVVAKGRRP